MLTGEVPFAGPLPALIHQALHVLPVPPSQDRPGIDARLDAICLKALAKKPEERYASGREMAESLRHSVLTQETQPRQTEKPVPLAPTLLEALPAAASPARGPEAIVHPSIEKTPPLSALWADVVSEGVRQLRPMAGLTSTLTFQAAWTVARRSDRESRSGPGRGAAERFGWLQELMSWGRRRPRVVLAAVGLLVAALVAGVVLTQVKASRQRQAETRRLQDETERLAAQAKLEDAAKKKQAAADAEALRLKQKQEQEAEALRLKQKQEQEVAAAERCVCNRNENARPRFRPRKSRWSCRVG